MDEWISIIRWIFEPGFPSVRYSNTKEHMYADYQFILTLISVSLSDCLSIYLSSSRFHLQVRQGSRWDKYRRGWKAGWGKGFNKGGGGYNIYLAKHGYERYLASVFSSHFSWEHFSKKSKLFVSFDSCSKCLLHNSFWELIYPVTTDSLDYQCQYTVTIP